MEHEQAGHEALEHLSDADLQLLASAADEQLDMTALRSDPVRVLHLLGRPSVFDSVFGAAARASERLAMVSPFLVFAVLVHRAASEIGARSYLAEPTGPRQRIPIFDTPQLAEFLDSPARRLFLAELLASFTRIASGRYRTRTSRGWRTRRFNELDPVRLAGLLEAAPENTRPGLYRRLGDVTLFLAGIFPDYVQTKALGPLDAGRLLRAAKVWDSAGDLRSAPAVQLFEHLGARWYRQAYDLVPVRTTRMDVVAQVAENFPRARRILNYVSDHYLYPTRTSWFGTPN